MCPIILCSVIVGTFLILVIALVSKARKKKNINNLKEKAGKAEKENALLAIDELRKIIKAQPYDYETRKKLIDLYFQQKMYLPAVRECMVMVDACATGAEVNELVYTKKIGEGYFHLKNYEEAKKYFLIARKISKNTDFLSSFYLGKIEFENQNNDKAIYFLNEAMKMDSNNLELVRLKGVLSFNIGSYREASLAMGKIVAANPGDTEAIYYLGISLFRINKFVDAVKYLSMVRNVALYQIDVEFTLATIYKKKGDLPKAVEVLTEVLDSVKKGTIANFPPNKACDIYYLLGDCYAASRETNSALAAFQEVVNINPRYKDASFRLEHCSQLSENTLLERFLVGTVNDFTSICKMFVKYYVAKYSHLRGSVKFFSADINSRGEMEIRAEVSSGKYATVVYFIFFRTNSTIGDFTLRSVYNMLKEEKIDKGVCVTAGTFSPTAVTFMESRMLDGIDKAQLSQILQEMTPLIHQKNS